MKHCVWIGLVLAGLGCDAKTQIGTAPDAGCYVSYPVTAFYGRNVLASGDSMLNAAALDASGNANLTDEYELAADLPPGSSLTLEMTLISGFPWSFGNPTQWLLTSFDSSTGKQRLAATNLGRTEGVIYFVDSGQARLDFFECGSQDSTRSQIISWRPPADAGAD